MYQPDHWSVMDCKHRSVFIVLALFLTCGITAVSLNSCATMGSVEQAVQQHKPLLKLAVQTGVVLFLREHPGMTQLVATIAAVIQHEVTVGPMDASTLMALLQQELAKARVPVEEQILLLALADILRQEVHTYLATQHVLPEQVPLVLGEVCGWIVQAAIVRGARREKE